MRRLRFALLLASCVAAMGGTARTLSTEGLSTQPTWERNDESGSQLHALLERAAVQHQQGELEEAVQLLKRAIKLDASYGEAHAALSKCLSDQGKESAAEKAMAKARRLHNDQLASWTLF